MRLLASSDIHGSEDVYRWLAKLVDGVSVSALVLAGDLLGHPTGFSDVAEAQRFDAERVLSILESLPVPVYFVMGNDDMVELGSCSDHVLSCNMRRVDQGEYNFVGYQYSPPFMGGIFERTEERIRQDLVGLEHLMDEFTVLVTHSPALGILDSTQLGHAGSGAIRDVAGARNVRAHIHGHIHQSFGRWGNHFNVAAATQRRAMIIDLDTMTSEVIRNCR